MKNLPPVVRYLGDPVSGAKWVTFARQQLKIAKQQGLKHVMKALPDGAWIRIVMGNPDVIEINSSSGVFFVFLSNESKFFKFVGISEEYDSATDTFFNVERKIKSTKQYISARISWNDYKDAVSTWLNSYQIEFKGKVFRLRDKDIERYYYLHAIAYTKNNNFIGIINDIFFGYNFYLTTFSLIANELLINKKYKVNCNETLKNFKNNFANRNNEIFVKFSDNIDFFVFIIKIGNDNKKKSKYQFFRFDLFFDSQNDEIIISDELLIYEIETTENISIVFDTNKEQQEFKIDSYAKDIYSIELNKNKISFVRIKNNVKKINAGCREYYHYSRYYAYSTNIEYRQRGVALRYEYNTNPFPPHSMAVNNDLYSSQYNQYINAPQFIECSQLADIMINALIASHYFSGGEYLMTMARLWNYSYSVSGNYSNKQAIETIINDILSSDSIYDDNGLIKISSLTIKGGKPYSVLFNKDGTVEFSDRPTTIYKKSGIIKDNIIIDSSLGLHNINVGEGINSLEVFYAPSKKYHYTGVGLGISGDGSYYQSVYATTPNSSSNEHGFPDGSYDYSYFDEVYSYTTGDGYEKEVERNFYEDDSISGIEQYSVDSISLVSIDVFSGEIIEKTLAIPNANYIRNIVCPIYEGNAVLAVCASNNNETNEIALISETDYTVIFSPSVENETTQVSKDDVLNFSGTLNQLGSAYAKIENKILSYDFFYKNTYLIKTNKTVDENTGEELISIEIKFAEKDNASEKLFIGVSS